jgi:hypothetical protein
MPLTVGQVTVYGPPLLKVTARLAGGNGFPAGAVGVALDSAEAVDSPEVLTAVTM